MITKTLIALFFASTILSAETITSTLSRVVDGDTAVFTDGKRVRFANIDTPESKPNKKGLKDARECGVSIDQIVYAGHLSSEQTKQMLVPGSAYRLECAQNDQYGRAVCEIYKGEQNINLTLVRNGYAVPFERYIRDQQKLTEYRNALGFAESRGLGLWNKSNRVIECMKDKAER